jgi:hypothetical protein
MAVDEKMARAHSQDADRGRNRWRLCSGINTMFHRELTSSIQQRTINAVNYLLNRK